MAHHPTIVRITVGCVVVLTAATLGFGVSIPAALDTPVVVDRLGVSPSVGQLEHVAGGAVVSASTRFELVFTQATSIVSHAPELLMVVELGLLVEHLRLLNRVGDSLHGGSDRATTAQLPLEAGDDDA